jgi:TolB-like protein
MAGNGSLFSTLTKKRIFQIAIVYIGFAWAVTEMVGFSIDNYGVSRKLLDVVVFLLIMGLPAVLTIGWFHGEKGHQQIGRTELSLLLTLFVMAAVGTYRIGTAEEPLVSGNEPAEQTDSAVRFASQPADLGPRSVAVFSFENQAEADSLDWLGSAVADMLTTNLAQLPELRVVSRERLLELLGDAGQEESDQIPQRLATEIASQSGARMMVRGSVLAINGELAVDAQLIELENGTVLAAERARGDDVFALVDDLSARFTRSLATETGLDQVRMAPLTAVTTPSLPAYREYHEGMRLEREKRSQEAAKRFAKAVELDSGFALAMLRLSENESIDSVEAAQYLKTARGQIVKLSQEYGPQLRSLVRIGSEDIQVALDSVINAAVHAIEVSVGEAPAVRDTTP